MCRIHAPARKGDRIERTPISTRIHPTVAATVRKRFMEEADGLEPARQRASSGPSTRRPAQGKEGALRAWARGEAPAAKATRRNGEQAARRDSPIDSSFHDECNSPLPDVRLFCLAAEDRRGVFLEDTGTRAAARPVPRCRDSVLRRRARMRSDSDKPMSQEDGPLSDAPGAVRPELSIVMPCLNEAETIGVCIQKANVALRDNGISGEIIVADNGSTDGSQDIARRMGARVVSAAEKGYGSALMTGIAAARGEYVLMGDADDSYDFGEAQRFLRKLKEGYDLVQGCRLESGGGTVLPGAMPFLHRWLGNPLFSYLARSWFRVAIQDIHCGLRAFRAQFLREIDLRCTGMEFASEMIIKATLRGARIAEIPITLRPDGRVSRSRHLRTFRDGWRHLRFFLLFSPRRLFLIPGELLILLGLVGYGVAMPRFSLGGVTFDVNTLLFASLAIICGYQSILFAVFTKVFAITAGMLPEDPRMSRLFALFDLEKGLLAGALMMLLGGGLLAAAVSQWRVAGFGPLRYEHTLRWVIPGMTLTAVGFQTVFSSFFLSILGMRRR